MTLKQTPQRDRAWGRFYARRGGARVLEEGMRALTPYERMIRFLTIRLRLQVEQTLPQRISR